MCKISACYEILRRSALFLQICPGLSQGRNTGFYANSEESMKIGTNVVEDILFNILRGNNPISRCFHDFSRFLGGECAFSVNFFVFWPILMGSSPLWKQQKIKRLSDDICQNYVVKFRINDFFYHFRKNTLFCFRIVLVKLLPLYTFDFNKKIVPYDVNGYWRK